MRGLKNNTIRYVATPTIAALLAASLAGCSGYCGKNGGTKRTERVDAWVEDASEWVDENGELIGDCAELCYLGNVPGDEIKNAKCTIHGVTTGTEGPGGAGGQGSLGDTVDVACDYTSIYYCEGRRHACWQDGPQGTGENAIGAWIARAASAEAGSVQSFHQLVRELARFDAPVDLIERAKDAMRDEVVHARMMTWLAADWGGQAQAIVMAPLEERSLFELALENATEGCTGETFAALVALHQAEHAQDTSIAQRMRRIAADETRHGQLAWDLHSWFLTQLSSEQAAQLNAALVRSLEGLAHPLVQEQMSADQRMVLGLPDADELPKLAGKLVGLLRPYAAVA